MQTPYRATIYNPLNTSAIYWPSEVKYELQTYYLGSQTERMYSNTSLTGELKKFATKNKNRGEIKKSEYSSDRSTNINAKTTGLGWGCFM